MEEKEFDYINMVPLIDVMLVLLTIVLMTSTFIVSGVIPVELPKARANQGESLRAVTVEINRDGVLYYQGQQVTKEQIRTRLASVQREMPLLIRADKSVPLQGFVEVLDLLKGLGFTRISLQAEKVRE
jgi:biopolymer transport protein ExbD